MAIELLWQYKLQLQQCGNSQIDGFKLNCTMANSWHCVLGKLSLPFILHRIIEKEKPFGQRSHWKITFGRKGGDLGEGDLIYVFLLALGKHFSHK